jgi:decaprenylphospho-beta-D-ribofuranose 2-oxidase
MQNKFIQNWGNFPKIKSEVLESSNYSDIKDLINKSPKLIARGNRRCYGDRSLQSTIISTLKLNKFLLFDKEKGILKTESGVLLSEILEVIVPCVFFLSVTPGTQWITIGGAVASNIHGKNHHKEGAISNFIESFELITDESNVINCSKNENPEIFINTIGGMGLTGIITTVTIQLKRIETSYIKQKTIKAKCLSEVLDYFEQYNHYTYSVAWIDCLKKGSNMERSILMLGEHAKEQYLTSKGKKQLTLHSDKQINIPIYLRNFTLNPFTIGFFNELYYKKQLSKEKILLFITKLFFIH